MIIYESNVNKKGDRFTKTRSFIKIKTKKKQLGG